MMSPSEILNLVLGVIVVIQTSIIFKISNKKKLIINLSKFEAPHNFKAFESKWLQVHITNDCEKSLFVDLPSIEDPNGNNLDIWYDTKYESKSRIEPYDKITMFINQELLEIQLKKRGLLGDVKIVGKVAEQTGKEFLSNPYPITLIE